MTCSVDPFDLDRFVAAQAPVYRAVIDELTAGRKRSHWMWFVFPQVAGLGSSAMAQRFAIAGVDEAAAYLAHPLLGSRLVECTELVVAIDDATPERIFGWPDNVKFHSSMTLFSTVSDHHDVVDRALSKYFGDVRHAATLEALSAGS